MIDYDADRAPDAKGWRSAGQADRVDAVEAHHAAARDPHPPTDRPRVHAALHVVVEDQLARGEPPEVRKALDRLVAGGLRRHEALHAIGRVASDALAATLAEGRFDARSYASALDALTPAAARAAASPD